MKYLAGVLAIATLSLAAPEADPAYALYAPWGYPYAAYYRPYYASGYAGPLPGNSYQAVTRLHKREAEADPQLLLNAAPFALAAAPVAPAFSLAPAPAVFNTPLVKTVVETPATVAHTVHASPLLAYAPVAHAAPVVHTGPLVLPTAGVPVALGPHDCVTEGGCALKAALYTGLPASTVGATSVYGRKRREAEAEATADAAADADAEADPYLLYGNYYGYPYAGHAYGAYPYAAHYPYYNYAPYAAYAPYYASYAPHYAAALTAPVAPVAPVAVAAPVAAVHTVAAPAVVETVSKPVTYTHLGAHPIAPTTVIQTEHRLVGK